MTARHCLLSLLIFGCASSAAGAQNRNSDSARAERSLFVQSDLYVLGAFVAGTVAMFPLDRHLASVVRHEDLVGSKDLRRAASAFRFFGGPGPFIIGSSMYVVGRAAHVPRMVHLAVHGTEAVVVGIGTSFVLKALLGRGRPYISADTNPTNFGLGRGFRSASYQSFPSGHSTAAFSVAAAVTAETTEWWPKSTWVVGPVLYGGATLVGASRMYDDKHWASDVVMGAAVGVFAGLKTVRFSHTHAGNRLDRWLLGSKNVDAHLTLHAGPDGTLGLGANLTW